MENEFDFDPENTNLVIKFDPELSHGIPELPCIVCGKGPADILYVDTLDYTFIGAYHLECLKSQFVASQQDHVHVLVGLSRSDFES